ncbi:MAG: ISAzo13 family transposase, partial [Pseudomonadota bacterium]
MKDETAGDPMSGLRWTKKATQKIAVELTSGGINVSAKTVGRLLHKIGFTLKTCRKNIEAGRKYKPDNRKRRDKQFKKMKHVRGKFERLGFPVVSVDSKKKEKVGN